MYTIYADNVCIHNDMMDVEALRVLSPSLSMSDSAAGSLSFTILPSNPGYDILEPYSTTITVYKNNKWFWTGRVISDSTDFYHQKAVECEGVLAFLNDTHQPSWSSESNIPMFSFISRLLSVHNSKVNSNRRIQVGRITIDGGLSQRYTEYESTLEAINDVLEDTGGHAMIRYSNNTYYLDILADWNDTNSQEIRFGKNLLDFTTSRTRENFGTAIYPLGKEDDQGNRLTIESVNDGDPCLKDNEAVSKWGYIEKKFEDNEITSAATLKSVATKILETMISEDITLELSAVDLSMLDNTIEDIRLYDQVRVISPYHDLDQYFPVTSVELDLAEPQNNTFTLGEEASRSLSGSNSTIGSAGSVNEKGENILPGDKLLQQALSNSTQILNTATNGYVTTVYSENGTSQLIISDNINYKNATRLWRWNINGLGYSKDGGNSYELAITMNGAINAKFVTTGTMTAARINGDILRANKGDAYFDLDNSKIHLGTSSSYWLELNYDGKLTAGVGNNTYGYIDGSADVHNLDDDTYSKGLNIVAPYHPSGYGPSVIRLVSERIAVLSSTDSSQTSTNCGTGQITVLTGIDSDGGTTTYHWTTYNIINGLIATALD